MTRTITALFDTRADADAASTRLQQAEVGATSVAVHDQDSHRTDAGRSTHADQGLWASIKHAFLPDEDRHTYEEGLRRGGFLLTADVADDQVAAAVSALEDANSVDLDERAQDWRASGWEYAADSDARGDTVWSDRDTSIGSRRVRGYSPLTPR